MIKEKGVNRGLDVEKRTFFVLRYLHLLFFYVDFCVKKETFRVTLSGHTRVEHFSLE